MDLVVGWLNKRMRGALPPTEVEMATIIERPGVMIRGLGSDDPRHEAAGFSPSGVTSTTSRCW